MLRTFILLFSFFLPIIVVAQNETSLSEMDISEGVYRANVKVGKEYKNGFYNTEGYIIPPEYSYLPEKFAQRMKAQKDGKYGMINSSNGILIPFEYDEIHEVPFEKGYYIAISEDKLTKFDSEGTEQESNITFYEPNLYAGWISIGYDNERFTFIDLTGKSLLLQDYDCAIKYIGVSNKYSTCKEGKYGVISFENEILLPFEYDYVEKAINDDLFIFKSNINFGVVDKNKGIIIPAEFDSIKNFSYRQGPNSGKLNRFYRVEKNDKFGFYNGLGESISNIEYDGGNMLWSPSVTFIRVRKGEAWGLINIKGKEILPVKFMKNFKIMKDGLIRINWANGNQEFYDQSGNRVK